MHNGSYRIFKDKVIIRIKDRLCDTPTEMLSSKLFLQILTQCIRALARRNSQLLGIFDDPTNIDVDDLRLLIETLSFLTKLPAEHVVRVVDGSDQFFRSPSLFNAFVEYLYNYWREMQRLIVCDDSHDDRLDQRPYRTFNRTIESLTHLVRSTYRDVQENITGNHPRIYRQVRAGAEIATIAMPKTIDFPQPVYQKLNDISVIRQVLIYPPLIFNPPMNKRTGYGMELLHSSWIAHEFTTLQALHAAGADVPEPYASGHNAILMEYIGDEDTPAPTLNNLELERGEARRLFERVLYNLELMLAHGRVHADLSAYNVLYWQGKIWLIDFPQAFPPEANKNGFQVFRRDVTRICEYFSGQGVKCNPQHIAERLWTDYGHRLAPELQPQYLDEQSEQDRALWRKAHTAS